MMKDRVLIEQLERGLNIHDENTKTFFGLGKDDPMFQTFRKVSKIIQFGRLFYGGSDNGIYAQVINKVPECPLTLKEFKEAVGKYFVDHPDFQVFTDTVQELAETERLSINAFGRVRSLYGELAKTLRQALNSPIQGSAADFVTPIMIAIDKEFERLGLKSKLLLQVHDEIIFEIPEEELPIAFPIIKKLMCHEIEINGYRFSVPVDFELGTHWGRQGAFDEKTFKVIGASKH